MLQETITRDQPLRRWRDYVVPQCWESFAEEDHGIDQLFLVPVIVKDGFGDLLSRFEREIGAADHQQRNDQNEIEAVFEPDQQDCRR